MLTLFRKEIRSFFYSLTGYLVVLFFLVVNSLIIWVFPGDFNVLDGGYASLDSLFVIAPWLFLFLAPAITMRMFAEETKSGTVELLFTRPLSDLSIVLAKYLASLTLVLMSLLPTLVYFLSLYFLGNPQGNIDSGSTWGAYIGLFFLAAIYVSIGIFCSSLTDNQIVAFVFGVVLCFFFYLGWGAVASLGITGQLGVFLVNLGIDEHYKSIQRGVLDFRDVLYFLSVIGVFCYITRLKLESRKW
jgi:ABC-2 type transport system permease protein